MVLGEGDLDESLHRLARYFVPRQADIEAQIRAVQEAGPTVSRLNLTLVTSEQVVADVDATDADPEVRMMVQLGTFITWQSPYLSVALNGFRRKFNVTTDDLMGIFSKSPILDALRHTFYRRGVDAYLNGDFVVAAHILMPQIEHCLRRVLEIALRRSPIKNRRSKHSGMIEKNLNDILDNEPKIESYFGTDFTLFLRVLLCDSRSTNARNNMLHALWGPEHYQRPLADRVIQILVLLAGIRYDTKEG